MQIGGRRIGSITDIKLTDNNQAEITIEVAGRLRAAAPGHDGDDPRDARCRASPTATSQLTPGPNSNKKLDDGALLGTEKTTTIVDLDQLFNTLDPKTRKGLQNVIQGSATQLRTARALAGQRARPSTSTRPVDDRHARQPGPQGPADAAALPHRLVRARDRGGRQARRPDRRWCPTPTRPPARSRDENEALDATLAALPTTLRKANTTFVNLRSTLVDLDELVDASKPAPKELAPFLRVLRPLVEASAPTIHDLLDADQQAGPGQRRSSTSSSKTPTLAASRGARRSRDAITALRRSQPVIDYIRPYAPDLVAGSATSARARRTTTPTATSRASSRCSTPSPFTDNPAGGVLTPHARAPHGRPDRPASSTAARARPPSRGLTARTRSDGRLTAATAPRPTWRLRPEPGAARTMRRIALIALLLAGAASLAVLGTGASDGDGGGTTRSARSSTTPFSVIPGEDVKIAGVKVGRIDVARRHQRQEGRGRPRHRRAPASRTSARTRTCTIRPQSLIGEKFVECTPTQPRAAGQPKPPALERDREGPRRGPAPAARSTQHVARPSTST